MKEIIEIIIQVFAVGFGGIGVWFLWDFVTEFKAYKTESKNDIAALKREREEFKTVVRNAELSIGMRVNDLQQLHTDFRITVNDALMKLNLEFEQINSKTKNLDKVLANSIQLFRHYDQEIKTLKVEMSKITIFKGKS